MYMQAANSHATTSVSGSVNSRMIDAAPTDEAGSNAVILQLFSITIAARDAFTRASRSVESPALARLFLERAEDQARIASHLRAQL